MDQLLLSVFYPHNQRCLLVKSGILPLLDPCELRNFSYFFSLYKGQNVTMYFHLDEADKAVRLIKDHFYTFFETYKAKQPEVRFPLNRLFMNFPYNTLHFWDKNPFQSGGMYSVHKNLDYHTSLSVFCLKKLAGEQNWHDSLTFRIFLEILTILQSYIYRKYGIHITPVFDQLTEGLKNRAGDKANLVDSFFEQGKAIYREQPSEIDRYMNEVNKQNRMPNRMIDGFVSDWLNIIEKKKRPTSGEQTTKEIQDFVREIILDVVHKIDLSHKGLIQAIAVVSEAGTQVNITAENGDTIA